MEEAEFKKLTANSRDWEIYSLLYKLYPGGFVEKEIKSEHISGVNIEEQEKQAPKGETTVRETIQGIVRIITDKAVQIVIGIRSAWIPKSAIKNLESVVLEQGKPVSIDLHTWFAPKVEWKVI